MAQKHTLTRGKLYILSGPPATGKSAFARKAGGREEEIISSDKTRQALLGSEKYQGSAQGDIPKSRLYGWAHQNPAVFSIMEQAARARLEEKLTVFVDAQFLDDAERKKWAQIAEKNGCECEVILMDTPEDDALARDAAREFAVGEDVIRASFAKYQKTSSLPHRLVKPEDDAELKNPELPWNAGKWDVVGDFHALLPEVKELLGQAGWKNDGEIMSHPDGRQVLFMGDIIDRGPRPVESIEFVKKMCATGRAICLSGNHEHKLVKFFDALEKGASQPRSKSSGETADALLRLPEERRRELVNFLRRLPTQFEMNPGDGKPFYGFIHADQFGFEAGFVPLSAAVYGRTKQGKSIDSDGIYEKAFNGGAAKHILIRGHIPPTSPSVKENIFSLDRKQAYRGDMMLLPMDRFHQASHELNSRSGAFEKTVLRKKCDFDYDEACAQRYTLLDGMRALEAKKLAMGKLDPESAMSIWKYSRQVFWDHLWSKDPLIGKARGLVLTMAGEIAVHPFDKIFNYGEEDAGVGLPDNQEILLVEKLNGFLACVSPHPYKKGVLLPTTTGSFESPFVDMIKEMIDPELSGRLKAFFAKRPMTLMFEALHPKDPHIIEYQEKDFGLWLIGARELAPDAPILKEEALDLIAKELGARRPKVWKETMARAKQRVKEEPIEGFMVRDAITEEPLLKFKTAYYLVTKFVGRLSKANVHQMYAKPAVFKKNLEEEFEPLVDALVQNISERDFAGMEKEERTARVRDLVNQMRIAPSGAGADKKTEGPKAK